MPTFLRHCHLNNLEQIFWCEVAGSLEGEQHHVLDRNLGQHQPGPVQKGGCTQGFYIKDEHSRNILKIKADQLGYSTSQR